MLSFRSSIGCPPKDSMSAPPVEGLYDARGSEFGNSPFSKEQVHGKSTFLLFVAGSICL